GVLLLWRGRVQAAASLHGAWPVAQAQVVESRIELEPMVGRLGGEIMRRVAVVYYSYVVDGQTFESGSVVLPDRGGSTAVLGAYPPGSEIEIRYDPANPSAAALVTPRRPISAAHLVQGIGLLLLAAAAFAV